jgi:transcriptional regulator with XRE-family HTH domain
MELREAKESTASVGKDLPNFIATNLRHLRKSKGWSQTELARRVSLNRGNIASYESGSAEPSICKLLRISNLFEVNPRDITRRNFLEAGELALAQHAYNDKRLQERERINHLRNRAMEMDELIRSSKRLFEYKRSGIENTCKEAEMFAAQYQQLHEITRQLMDEHRSLLGEVGCQCE